MTQIELTLTGTKKTGAGVSVACNGAPSHDSVTKFSQIQAELQGLEGRRP